MTKNGRPVGAIVSIEDLESLEATLEGFSDPGLMPASTIADPDIPVSRPD